MWFYRMPSLIKMIGWLHFIRITECGADSGGGWSENTEGWGGCSQAHFRTSGNYSLCKHVVTFLTVISFSNFMWKDVVKYSVTHVLTILSVI